VAPEIRARDKRDPDRARRYEFRAVEIRVLTVTRKQRNVRGHPVLARVPPNGQTARPRVRSRYGDARNVGRKSRERFAGGSWNIDLKPVCTTVVGSEDTVTRQREPFCFGDEHDPSDLGRRWPGSRSGSADKRGGQVLRGCRERGTEYR
jgi:hypothetical protein